MDPSSIRLKEARIAAGFKSASEAAAHFKVNVNTWTSAENGHRPPSKKTAPRFAHYLNVTVGYLLSGEGDERELRRVPVISWVSAGSLKKTDGVTAAEVERYVSVAELGRGEWVAFEVSGDSMNRVAPDGAIILVDRADDTLIANRFYVFGLEDGSATFKQWRREPAPILRPFSTNPDHMSIAADADEVYVVGRVRRVITEL